MKIYAADEADCQEVTPGLVPAPLRKAFNDAQVPKNPKGPMPGYYLRRKFDGYYFGMTSMAGSRFRLAGTDWALFTYAGMAIVMLLLNYFDSGLQSINPFSSAENDMSIIAIILWSSFWFFLLLGLWVHYLAKKDAMSVIIFNREHGTVTFPKIANREGLTVPFEDVDLAVADRFNPTSRPLKTNIE